MYIYIILFVIWFIFEGIFLSIKKNASDEYKNMIQKKFTFIICFILFIICAFRAYSYKNYVGIDTQTYYSMWNNNLSADTIHDLLNFVHNDEGYYILGWILGKMNFSFVTILILEAIMYVGIMYKFIIKYSKEPLISLLFFICLLFTFSMSTIRQSIAMGICLLAYMLYDKYKHQKLKSLIIYGLLVMLAISFHKSAIIFVPAILIPKIRYNKKIVFIFLAIATLTMIFKTQFSSVFMSLAGDYSQKYASYSITGDNVGTKFYIFVLFFVLLSIIFSKKLSKDSNSDSLIYMMLAMLIIFPAVQSGGAMMRIYYYYYMFAPVYMANTLNCITDKNLKLLAKLLIIVFLVYLFFNGNLVANRLAPYHFSFGDF